MTERPATVTCTFTVPEPVGVVQEILFALTAVTVAALPPKVTVVEPLINPVPVITTGVPPAVVPDDGLTAVMVGSVALYKR